MILDLLLDPVNSLLFDSTALEEVEIFLLNAQQTLTEEELKTLKEFIKRAPDSESEKGILFHRKEHFLDLIDKKTQPIGSVLFKMHSGWVGPVMAEKEFSALTDDEIADRLVSQQPHDFDLTTFTDIFQDWHRFVPHHPERAWNILQQKKENNELWIQTAWPLAQSYNQRLEKSDYEMQWKTFSKTGGFLESYITRKLEPKPIIGWLNHIASQLALNDEIYLEYWFKLWESSKNLPISEASTYSGNEVYRDDYLSTAINDARGKLAEGVLDALYRHKPELDSKIPTPLLAAFNTIFDAQTESGWLAQLIFARHFRNLLFVDKVWTKLNLLQAFDYNKAPEKASRMWVGFLYNPNLSFESFETLKPLLLDLLSKWEQILPKNMHHLKDLRKQLIHLMTFYKISFPDSIEGTEFQQFFKELEEEDLYKLFRLFEELLNEPLKNGQDLSFWEKSLQPFFEEFWPAQKGSSRISLCFLELAAQCPNALIPISEYLKCKHFLTKADFTLNRFLYSISQRETSNFQAILKSLDNAKAFIDLFWMAAEALTESEATIENGGFYKIKDFFERFTTQYPELRRYENFKKLQKKFENLLGV